VTKRIRFALHELIQTLDSIAKNQYVVVSVLQDRPQSKPKRSDTWIETNSSTF
jgi:hypothetical protein